MITTNQILDAINKVVLQEFPNMTVYRDGVPEKFERPSLFLAYDPLQIVSRSGFLVECRQLFSVQIMDETDESLLGDTDRLTDIIFRLTTAFGAALPCRDRHLHIERIAAEREGPIGPNGAVDLTLHWFEYQPAVPPAKGETAATAEISVRHQS